MTWDEDHKIIKGATPGPWWSGWWRDVGPGHNVGSPEHGMVTACGEGAQAEADATFIAAARTRWPAALERIAELEGLLRRIRQWDVLEGGRLDAERGLPHGDAPYWCGEIDRLLSQDKPNG